jgi:hypothetical protein
VASRQHAILLFFTREFSTKNNITVVPQLPCISLFSRLKIKLKIFKFDTVDVIEAESKAVLNTNTTYREHLKTDRSSGNGEYTQN